MQHTSMLCSSTILGAGVLTNVGMFIRALGDVFSQKIEGAQRIDSKRSLMTAGYGLTFIGAF